MGVENKPIQQAFDFSVQTVTKSGEVFFSNLSKQNSSPPVQKMLPLIFEEEQEYKPKPRKQYGVDY